MYLINSLLNFVGKVLKLFVLFTSGQTVISVCFHFSNSLGYMGEHKDGCNFQLTPAGLEWANAHTVAVGVINVQE